LKRQAKSEFDASLILNFNTIQSCGGFFTLKNPHVQAAVMRINKTKTVLQSNQLEKPSSV